MIDIDYMKISLEELDRIYFIHCEMFAFFCDGDRKKIIIEQESKINLIGGKIVVENHKNYFT